MNKIFKIVMVLILALAMVMSLSSCRGENSPNTNYSSEKKIVLCADFAEYDWAKNIQGSEDSNLEIRLLNETGADMHSFQPSVKDMVSIAECELLIYTDGISEFWMDEALNASGRDSLNELSLMEAFMHSELKNEYDLSAFNEENHEDGEDDDESHHHEADEHLWTSVKLAKYFCALIEEKMEELDPDNAEAYRENLRHYLEELDKLEKEYDSLSAEISGYTVLLCDRYPFFYLSQDTGICFEAAFENCEADAEASFDVIIRLAKLLEEKNLKSVFVLENSSDELANSVIRAAADDIEDFSIDETEIYTLDSMQSISLSELLNGADYISVMRKNLETLKLASGR